MKSSAKPTNIGVQFQQLTRQFTSFIEGNLTNFTTMATVMANDDKREQLALERSNALVDELIKLGLPSAEVFKEGDIIGAEPSKLTMFFSYSTEMRKKYVKSSQSFSSFLNHYHGDKWGKLL